MKRSTGIALVITLIIAVVLFVSILAISGSFSLTGRRVTTDQKMAIEAQYAAESGLSLAAARLKGLGEEVAEILSDDEAFELPANTDWLALRSDIVNFCGNEEDVPATNPPVGDICESNQEGINWDDPSRAPYSLFVRYVNPEAYPIDPDTGSPVDAGTFWRKHLGPQTSSQVISNGEGQATGYTVEYGFIPHGVKVLSDGSIRFEFIAMPTTSTGQLKNGSEVLATRKIRQEYLGKLYIDVSPPSFSHYMMFTNYQRSGSSPRSSRVYFFDGTLFDGPVHTNEHFNFVGDPWFGDSVTSAGCTKENSDKTGCLMSEPGYYYWDDISQTHVFTPPILPPPAYMNTNPTFTKEPVWDAKYIALPDSGSGQYDAAVAGGIQIDDDNDPDEIGGRNILDLVFSIGEEGGKKYQYIQVFGRELVDTQEIPGYCAPDSSGGGGGGDDEDDEGEGPPVRLPDRPGLMMAAIASKAAPSLSLKMLANAADRITAIMAVRAEDFPCPPGWHWVPPRTKKIYESFTYSYRIDSSGLVEINEGDGWSFYASDFNGVVYVGTPRVPGSFGIMGGGISQPYDGLNPWSTHNPRYEVSSPGSCDYTVTEFDGKYYCIEPSIADFSQLTVAGHGIAISRDLTYEDRPCQGSPERQSDGVEPATCDNLEAKNILGIYADAYDIRIHRKAPPNMYIDGVLMSAKRSVYYAKWETSDPMGFLHLTGGIIQNWYGRFGKLDTDMSIKHGYGRKFTYDPRLRNSGLAPPFFPKFEGALPWSGRAVFEGSGGSEGSGFWKPVTP